MTNNLGIFIFQQMMKHRPEQKSTTSLSTKHNVHHSNYYKPTWKRGRLSTATPSVEASCDYNLYQQSMKFHPNFSNKQVSIFTNWPIVNMQSSYNKLPNVKSNIYFHNRYFPGYNHLTVFNPFLTFQETHS